MSKAMWIGGGLALATVGVAGALALAGGDDDKARPKCVQYKGRRICTFVTDDQGVVAYRIDDEAEEFPFVSHEAALAAAKREVDDLPTPIPKPTPDVGVPPTPDAAPGPQQVRRHGVVATACTAFDVEDLGLWTTWGQTTEPDDVTPEGAEDLAVFFWQDAFPDCTWPPTEEITISGKSWAEIVQGLSEVLARIPDAQPGELDASPLELIMAAVAGTEPRDPVTGQPQGTPVFAAQVAYAGGEPKRVEFHRGHTFRVEPAADGVWWWWVWKGSEGTLGDAIDKGTEVSIGSARRAAFESITRIVEQGA